MSDSNENDTFFTSCTVGKTSVMTIHQFPDQRYERSHIAVIVCNIMLIFSTISLNGISVITIRNSSQLRNKICYFMVQLQSVVDLSVGILGIPLFIYHLITPYLDNVDCTLVAIASRTSTVPAGLSILTMLAMAIERYIGVIHPYRYQTHVTKRRILFFVLGNGLILFFAVGYSFRDPRLLQTYLRGLVFVFLVLTGFVYTRIYLVIRKIIRSEARPAYESEESQDKRKIFRESRHARSCFLVVICFAVCMLPVTLGALFFSSDEPNFRMYSNWTLTMVISNSSINSVIFFWTKTLLRTEALKILKSVCF